ncbi:MAG TPA: elongation factor G, partial [Bacteroidetes bacterium]|nr:elongation factor G [Bacteroidota bacterium]
DQLSFEIAGRLAFRHATRQAGPVILEPIMAVEVVMPEEHMGSVVGDLNKRRGQIEGMDSRGNDRVVKAKVPLSEMFGYVTSLRTITSGRAASTMQFSHYARTPRGIQEEIVKKIKGA